MHPVINKEPCHEDVWGSGGTAPRIRKPKHLIEVSGQFHALGALSQVKRPRYPVDRSWMGPRAGLDAAAKIPAPAGNRTPDVQPE
jgi:hypothetical protein